MPTKTKPKLKPKPCPFCGRLLPSRVRIKGMTSFVYKVECQNANCVVRPATDWFSKQLEADNAWNKRAK